MSEQFPGSTPTENPQDEQAQFDADAAQKAKEFLEEGVTWSAPSRIYESQKVVDQDGLRVDRSAYKFVGQAIDEQDLVNKTVKSVKKATDKYDVAQSVLDSADLAARENDEPFYNSAARVPLAESRDKLKRKMEKHKGTLWDAEDRRDAALWRGTKDYQQNQAGYQINAIQDATAAGHEINFGGHTFPAGEPVNPDHYEQKIQALQEEQQPQGGQPVVPREPQLQ